MKAIWHAFLQTFSTIAAQQTLLTTLVLSVVFYSFFYPTAYKAEHAEHLPIIVVDEEQSVASQQLIHYVMQSPNVFVTTVSSDFLTAQQQVAAHQADGILLIPSTFSASILRGETGGIGLYLSTANFLVTKQIGLGIAASIEQSIKETTAQVREISDFSPALSIHQMPLFNPQSGYGSYIFPAIAPLIIHQTILLGLGMLIAAMRQQQPNFRYSTLIGMQLAIFTIGCLGCWYLFGFTYWWYDYPRGGNFGGMLLAVVIYVSCVTAFASLIGSFLDQPERAGHVLVFTSIPLFLLSGVAWPHAAMPEVLGHLGRLFPSTQGIQLFIQLNQMGVPTQLVTGKLLYLFCFAVICFLWAGKRLCATPLASVSSTRK